MRHGILAITLLLSSTLPAGAGTLFRIPWGKGAGQAGYYNASVPGFDQPGSEGPGGITRGAGGEVWISDQWNDRILCFSRDGRLLKSLAQLGTEKVRRPKALALSGDRELLVLNSDNQTILRYDLATGAVRKAGSRGRGSGQLSQAELLIGGLAGEVCAEDDWSNQMVCFSPDGQEILRRPWVPGGLATDGHGRAYTLEFRGNPGSGNYVLVSTDPSGARADHFRLEFPRPDGSRLESPLLVGIDGSGRPVVRFVKQGRPNRCVVARYEARGGTPVTLGETLQSTSKQAFSVAPDGTVLGLSFDADGAPSGSVEVVEFR